MKKLGSVAVALLYSCTSSLCSSQMPPSAAPAAGTSYAISTLPEWTGLQMSGFLDLGVPEPTPTVWAAMTMGQTFRVNGGVVRVTSIMAPIYDRSPQHDPLPSDFQIGVAAWDGIRPTGSVLYLSDHLVAYDSTWRDFVVTPSNLILNEGQDYVLFFTPMNFLDGVQSSTDMGDTGPNAYADGHTVFLVLTTTDPTVGVGALFDQDWRTFDPGFVEKDVAFEIQYETIPEPTTFALLGLGSLALVMARRRW